MEARFPLDGPFHEGQRASRTDRTLHGSSVKHGAALGLEILLLLLLLLLPGTKSHTDTNHGPSCLDQPHHFADGTPRLPRMRIGPGPGNCLCQQRAFSSCFSFVLCSRPCPCPCARPLSRLGFVIVHRARAVPALPRRGSLHRPERSPFGPELSAPEGPPLPFINVLHAYSLFFHPPIQPLPLTSRPPSSVDDR